MDPEGVPETCDASPPSTITAHAYRADSLSRSTACRLRSSSDIVTKARCERTLEFLPPERCRSTSRTAVRGTRPATPSFGFQIPSVLDPQPRATRGHHAASAYAFYFPIVGRAKEHNQLKDQIADRVSGASRRWPHPTFRRHRTHAGVPCRTPTHRFRLHRRRLLPRLLQPEIWDRSSPGLADGTTPPAVPTACICQSSGCHGGPRGHVHPRLQLRLRRRSSKRAETPSVNLAHRCTEERIR